MPFTPTLEPLSQSRDFDLYGTSSESGVVTDEDALFQSVEAILRIQKNTGFFAYSFGGVVDDSLFEIIDSHIASILEAQIQTAILSQEPRVTSVRVTFSSSEESTESSEIWMEIFLTTQESSAPTSPRKYRVL